MTTSQRPRYGRHAWLDEQGSTPPSVPRQRPVRPLGVDDDGPAFGEWPFGARTPEPEPVGPDPYLPCEDAAPEVRLSPGGLPGTLALVAGVVGVGLAMFPIIAIAVWPLTILGIVLGVVGLRRIRAGAARNSVAAVAGIVLSAAGLVLCAAWLSMYALAGVSTAGEGRVDVTGPDAVPAVVR